MRLSVIMAVPRGMVESKEAKDAFQRELDHSAGDELIVEAGASSAVLVPELWTRGIARSRGELVALTLGSMAPDPGWGRAVRERMEDGIGGVGGAIEPKRPMRWVEWAIHFCRYSAYLLPFDEKDVEDLPGDNSVYRRSALESCRPVWAEGFWETEVDRELRRAGARLRLTPAMIVRQGPSVGFSAFVRNRFTHGVRFGRQRGARAPLLTRLARALGSPVVPLLLWSRALRRTRVRGYLGPFLRATPLLLILFAVWALGEAVGSLDGRH